MRKLGNEGIANLKDNSASKWPVVVQPLKVRVVAKPLKVRVVVQPLKVRVVVQPLKVRVVAKPLKVRVVAKPLKVRVVGGGAAEGPRGNIAAEGPRGNVAAGTRYPALPASANPFIMDDRTCYLDDRGVYYLPCDDDNMVLLRRSCPVMTSRMILE